MQVEKKTYFISGQVPDLKQCGGLFLSPVFPFSSPTDQSKGKNVILNSTKIHLVYGNPMNESLTESGV